MGTVDDRVVNLSFNNKQFQDAAMQSMSTLDKLKQSLNFSSSSKGMDNLAASVKGVQMDPLATSVEGVSGKFLALATVGVTALSTITNMAVQAGLSITKSLTISPIGAGFSEYELKMGAIQTIMAGSGEKLKVVNKYLNELNAYSDRTIYSFADMTQNIGKFTNAGVNLKTAVAAIQGIANVAAVSGSNAEEASRAMYNFAQALSKGSVALIDWKSIEFANMATVEFKTNLLNVAVATGTLTKTSKGYLTHKGTLITATKGFNDSLNEEWLTTKVLTSTLSDYASQTTKIGKKANAAAQDVKTWSQLLSTLQESAGSGWATSFEIIFGNIDEAKTLWTGLKNVIDGFIQGSSDSRNQFLQFFKDIKGFKTIVSAIMSWINPIKQAWKDIFPPTASDSFKTVAKTIKNFFSAITLNAGGMQYLREAFQGFFSILSLGWTAVKGVFGFLKNIFGILTAGAPAAGGGLLALAGHLGQAATRFKQFLESTNAIPAFFNRLTVAVGPTVVKIREFLNTIRDAVNGALGQLPEMLDRVRGAATNADQQGLTPMQKTINFLKNAWDSLVVALQKVVSFFGTVGQTIKDAFTGATSGTGDPGTSLVDKIKKAFESVNWPNVFKATIAVALMAMVVNVTRFVMATINVIKNIVKAGDSFIKFVDGLGGMLKTLQNNVKANTMLKIAASILLLAISLKILSTIPIEDLLKSLAVVYILFEMLNTFAKEAGKSNANVAKAAGSMVLMAIALNILALAVLAFGNMDMDVLKQGLISIAIALGSIMLVMNLLPKSGQFVAAGAGIMLMAQALIVLSAAVYLFGNMDIEVLKQGMLSVFGILGGIMLVMNLLPPEGKMMAAGAGIVLMAVALNLLIIPVKLLGSMNVDQLNQGLLAMIIILGSMALAMYAMSSPGVFAGAAGMLVAAAAMMVMAGVVKVFASMTLNQIVIGLLGIAGVMIVVAAAATALSFAIPFITAFGLAMIALGAGFALLGVGMLAGATAFSIVLGLMALGIPVLSDMLTNFITLVPLMGQALLAMLTEAAQVIIQATPVLVLAFVTLVTGLLGAFDTLVPSFMNSMRVLLDALIRVMVEFIPDLVNAGWDMLKGLLKGIEDHIGDITTTAFNIAIKFLKAIAKKLPDLIKSGTAVIIAWIKGMGKAASDIAKAAGDTVLTFLTEITNWINNNTERINIVMKELAKAIINGLIAGVSGLVSGAGEAVGKLFSGIVDGVKNFLGIASPSKVFITIGKNVIYGFITGVVSGKQDTINAMKTITDQIKTAKDDAINNIKDLKNKIKDLEARPMTTANKAALAKAKAELKIAEAEKAKLDAAYKTITVEHKADIAKLKTYAGQYDALSANLEKKKDQLKEAQKLYDDYAKSITDKYSSLPTIESTTSLDEYFNAIRDATTANVKFKATMEQLRSLGLDDNQYRKFMEQGTAIQPFLDQLLASGGGTIAELNNIDSTLLQSATDLGRSGADALYAAGVDAAQGLVDGLEAQMDSLIDKMKTLGAAIAKELKRELGIKSPSKVFSEIGKNTMLGLADGMDKNAKVIDISARRTGQIAVESLKKSLMGLAIDEAIDVQPIIAPVLDLNSFRKDALKMDSILSTKSLRPTVTTQNAVATNSALEATKAAIEASTALQATGTTVELTQINNSPKALSSAEIYRQTKNQLSILKGALSS